jgi:hypothetical protein
MARRSSMSGGGKGSEGAGGAALYDFTALKNATATFCAGLLVPNSSLILHDLLSPDCKFSSAGKEKEIRKGDAQCMESLLEFQTMIFQFEKEHGSLRRGLKINEKKQKTRILLLPSNVTMTFRIGFILQWECGVLVHVTVVEDPWQGFLDELTASEENRKLDQQSTNNLRKSVSSSHLKWRKISDVVVDAFVTNVDESGGGTEHEIVKFTSSHPDTLSTEEPLVDLNIEGELSISNDQTSDFDSNNSHAHVIAVGVTDGTERDETATSISATNNIDTNIDCAQQTRISSDENIFTSGATLEDIKIDLDSVTDDKVIDELTWDNTIVDQPLSVAVEKNRIRFDTTVNALLVNERCEIECHDDLFYSQSELKAFQNELNNEITSVQKQHQVKFEVATKIYFCNTPDEIQEIKNEGAIKKGPDYDHRKKIISNATKNEKSNWFPGKNLPLVRLVRAYKKRQKSFELMDDIPRRRSSSHTVENYAEVEGRISEIRSDSFGTSARGRDPEATKFVISVKVLCCVNLNARKTKFMSKNNVVQVRVGSESFECPLVSTSSAVDNDNPTFLFSVSVDDAMHGCIEFKISSSALTKAVVGAARIPFVAIKNRKDSCQPSYIILPITSNVSDYKSIGRGFYCRSSDAIAGQNEESSFLQRMIKIGRLASPKSPSFDASKLTKLCVEITKVDVSGSDFTVETSDDILC